ncbi:MULTISPECIES: hypothetical protein [Bacillus]|uniref:DUF2178 domain-containing protein n=2 Tax=Bacillus TaxID=1386 RepID=A0A0M3R9K6_9BACI|nr:MULTISPECIES: hypothetical protein [Bacillus]ALC81602.1 hypothetical protein AM592_08290 [Bacillus gobiensis]MBP1080640.1 putative membrane protein [Bacillus capparidis]MED1094496.1 hypothetical protein [Bacillus capparidis]
MRIITKLIINLVLGVLACWAFIELYDSYSEFSKIIEHENGSENALLNGFEITINIIPLALLILAVIIYGLIFLKKEGSMKRLFRLTPNEFEEQDEREKMITAKSCRKAYIVMSISLPIAGGLLSMYPLVQHFIPYFPIILIFLLFAILHITYTVTYRKQLK